MRTYQLHYPLPTPARVHAMRKGRCPHAKATQARTLYALGLCVAEVAEFMDWNSKEIRQVLRRIA